MKVIPKQTVPTPSLQEMERTRIARFADLNVRDNTFAASALRGEKAGLITRKILGSGIVDPALKPSKITIEHPFSMTITELPPGHSASLHAHTTEEIFMILEGEMTFFWGPEGEYETVLGKYDTVTMPQHVFRAFENRTSKPTRMLIVLGGTYAQTKHSVTYHPEIVAKAKEAGVTLDGAVLDAD